jgi:GTP cyclohydrolase II
VRVQGRNSRVHAIKWNNIGSDGYEQLLMRVEGEHEGPWLKTTLGLFDAADAAIAIVKWVGKSSHQRSELLVKREGGRQQPPVGQQLCARADPGEKGPDQDLPLLRRTNVYLHDIDLAYRCEADGPCTHVALYTRGAQGFAARASREWRLMVPSPVREVARVRLPTSFAVFDARAFEGHSGTVHIALTFGPLADGLSVLTRVHSECLTGDALSSLRCDCGIQLRSALRSIVAEGRGILVYATGHEGRGIGLVNKLRAYVEQDQGSDTVDANLHLGLPVDARDYNEAAEVLKAIGVKSVKLMTNNPAKIARLDEAGVVIEEVLSLPVAASVENVRYVETKQFRMGHMAPFGRPLMTEEETPVDVTDLLGFVKPRANRPYVVVKYAQSVDGRIATASGDSKWISGQSERAISHALRARCDAIIVGSGTVVMDDPRLNVRLVRGASPLRVILDSSLRIPADAQVLDDEAQTVVVTTEGSDPLARQRLRQRGVAVRVVPSSSAGVDIRAALDVLAGIGVRSALVEGGAGVITSLLRAGLVDRLILSIAPLMLGKGVEAVGDLGVESVSSGLTLENRSVHLVGRDVMIAWDVAGHGEGVERGVGSSPESLVTEDGTRSSIELA